MNDRIRLTTVVRQVAVVIALTLAVAPLATAGDGGGETTAVAWSLPLAFEANVGQASDGAQDLALGSDGSVYVVGSTSSVDFPRAGTPLHAELGGDNDALLARLGAAGSTLVASTYLGGTRNGVGA